MQGIGYKELYAFLDGECELSEAVERIKLATRHFAKRQLTWFRREKDVIWIDTEGKGKADIVDEMIDIINNKTSGDTAAAGGKITVTANKTGEDIFASCGMKIREERAAKTAAACGMDLSHGNDR